MHRLEPRRIEKHWLTAGHASSRRSKRRLDFITVKFHIQSTATCSRQWWMFNVQCSTWHLCRSEYAKSCLPDGVPGELNRPFVHPDTCGGSFEKNWRAAPRRSRGRASMMSVHLLKSRRLHHNGNVPCVFTLIGARLSYVAMIRPHYLFWLSVQMVAYRHSDLVIVERCSESFSQWVFKNTFLFFNGHWLFWLVPWK